MGVTNIEGNPVETIEFWVASGSADYVITKPLHESQRMYRGDREGEMRQRYPGLEGGAFFSIECKMNYELTRELASFGCNLLVLSPESVQREVRRWFDQGSAAYARLG